MTTSLSPIRFPALRHTSAEINAKKAEEFQSLAQLVEDLIPNFKKEEERQFYREVVQSYRTAARDTLRKHGQTIKVKTSRNTRSCWQ